MKNTFKPRLLVAALVLSFGVAAGANAASPDAGVPPAQAAAQPMSHSMGHHMGHHGGKHMERGMRGLMRLHDELKLDARQEALWSEATNAGRDARTTMHERMRKEHDEMIAALNQPGADLRAIVKRMDEMHAQGQKQHEAMRDRWLALYDTLAPEQKEKARIFVKGMFERGGAHGMQGRHGGHGQHGKMPRAN